MVQFCRYKANSKSPLLGSEQEKKRKRDEAIGGSSAAARGSPAAAKTSGARCGARRGAAAGGLEEQTDGSQSEEDEEIRTARRASEEEERRLSCLEFIGGQHVRCASQIMGSCCSTSGHLGALTISAFETNVKKHCGPQSLCWCQTAQPCIRSEMDCRRPESRSLQDASQ